LALQLLVSGLLLGAVYSLVAMGLSLIWGVMGVINFAHGAQMMIAMYLAYWANVYLGFDPVTMVPLVVLAMFVFGIVTYKVVIAPVLSGPFLARLLVTFGLGIFLIYLAQFLWSPNYRLLRNLPFQGVFFLDIGPGLIIEIPKLVAAVGSLIVAALFYWLLKMTKMGLAIQAISTNRVAAALMGIELERMYALSFGLGIASAGAAGSLLANYYYIFPDVGTMFGLIALIAVALGGFGSIEGAFLGALILGIVEIAGGFMVGPAYKYALLFLLYILVVLIRPRGLLGWGDE
jgi:branched-chain amino acid transport system permease protein